MKYHVSSKFDLEITNYHHYILLFIIFLPRFNLTHSQSQNFVSGLKSDI